MTGRGSVAGFRVPATLLCRVPNLIHCFVGSKTCKSRPVILLNLKLFPNQPATLVCPVILLVLSANLQISDFSRNGGVAGRKTCKARPVMSEHIAWGYFGGFSSGDPYESIEQIKISILTKSQPSILQLRPEDAPKTLSISVNLTRFQFRQNLSLQLLNYDLTTSQILSRFQSASPDPLMSHSKLKIWTFSPTYSERVRRGATRRF